MIRFWTIVSLMLACGCQSAFEREVSYDPPTSAPSGRKIPSRGVVKVAFSDQLRLASAQDPAEVAARFSCDVQYPGDETLTRFVDETLSVAYRHARGEERKDVSTSGVKSVRDAFFDDYREWFSEGWPAVTNGEATAQTAVWTCHVEGRITDCTRTYFSYRVIIDTYCGGAHPNRWMQNATYLRGEGRRLKVVDIVDANHRLEVVNRIRQSLRAQAREDKALQARLKGDAGSSYEVYVRTVIDGWSPPLLTENFMLTLEGVIWTYNPYEIACYASGWFDARVPWCSDLKRRRDP